LAQAPMAYRSLDDLRKEEEKKDDKMTESYTGGEKSGMAVFNPKGFDEARERGAISSGPVPEGAVNVELYRDGFTINNGVFRPASDPINQRFIDDVMSGVAPTELADAHAAASNSGPVHMNVTDNRKEDYKPPALTQMGGQARRTPAQAGSLSEGATAGPVATGQGDVTIDESKPTTTLMIRYGDGTRKPQVFNQDSTVQAVYDFVAQVTGTKDFKLAGGFPPKPLTDMNVTIKDAGLLQAQLMVKQ